MDRMDDLVGNRGGSRNRGVHPRETSREPKVNFNEHSNERRTYGSTRGRSNPSSGATGSNTPRNPTNIRGGSIGSRPISNEQASRDAHARGRGDFINWNHTNEGRTQLRDSYRRYVPDSSISRYEQSSGRFTRCNGSVHGV